eukprot:GHVU01194922.1.p2 GENE.GHVU01194922.1~~GHVU01194922.1.p2  ORF type:complete len:331 (+),score=61.63 GHVU01194922.1:2011-3003(+)
MEDLHSSKDGSEDGEILDEDEDKNITNDSKITCENENSKSWLSQLSLLNKDRDVGKVQFLRYLLDTLEEGEAGLFERVVYYCDEKDCTDILEETQEIQRQGGEFTNDVRRLRSPGGVFLKLLKERLPQEKVDLVWKMQKRQKTVWRKEKEARYRSLPLVEQEMHDALRQTAKHRKLDQARRLREYAAKLEAEAKRPVGGDKKKHKTVKKTLVKPSSMVVAESSMKTMIMKPDTVDNKQVHNKAGRNSKVKELVAAWKPGGVVAADPWRNSGVVGNIDSSGQQTKKAEGGQAEVKEASAKVEIVESKEVETKLVLPRCEVLAESPSFPSWQ